MLMPITSTIAAAIAATVMLVVPPPITPASTSLPR